MTKKLWLAILLLLGISAAATTYPPISLDQILPKEQQERLGVDRLTANQREALRQMLIDIYLAGYKKGKEEASKTMIQAPDEIARESTVVESQIDGEFEGWEGETIIKLTNGQIWEQSEYHYEYHYAFMPKVFVYRSEVGYKMKVDGTDQAVGVVRLK